MQEIETDSADQAGAPKLPGRVGEAGGAGDEVAALIAAGASNPASPAAIALADAWRRAGRADEAVRVAREALHHQPGSMSVRVALALALLDLGKSGEARGELARAFEVSPERALGKGALERAGAESALRRSVSPASPVPPPAPAQPLELLDEIGGDELDRAFEAAESETEGVIDANDVAEQAIRAVETGGPGDLLSAPESPFATATMAELLERQGHADQARTVRERVAGRPEEIDGVTDSAQSHADDTCARERARVLATLEHWLENLRRGAA